MGCRQAVKARDFDSRIVGSNPATPATFFDPLAQSVEHLTFNQGVPGSNPGRVTIFHRAGVAELADALDLGSNTLRVCEFESLRPHFAGNRKSFPAVRVLLPCGIAAAQTV